MLQQHPQREHPRLTAGHHTVAWGPAAAELKLLLLQLTVQATCKRPDHQLHRLS